MKKIVFTFFLLTCTLAASAQNQNLTRLAGQEGVSYVYVSKAMLQMIFGQNAGGTTASADMPDAQRQRLKEMLDKEAAILTEKYNIAQLSSAEYHRELYKLEQKKAEIGFSDAQKVRQAYERMYDAEASILAAKYNTGQLSTSDYNRGMLRLEELKPKETETKIAGIDVAALAGKLNSIQVVSANKPEAIRRLRTEAANFPKAHMEVLMQVIDADSRTEFFTLKQGDTITDLLMISDSGNEYTLLLIQGRFTSRDIQKITEATSK